MDILEKYNQYLEYLDGHFHELRNEEEKIVQFCKNEQIDYKEFRQILGKHLTND